MLDVAEVRSKNGFNFAVVRGTPADHASWWSFDDEQELRDRWWHPKAGEVVLDIGAAFGSYALPALVAGARVVCFSPADFDTELLQKNLELNPDLKRRCLVVRDGLHSVRGWFNPDENLVGAMADGGKPGGGQWLRVRPLDEFLAERPGIERVDWMKLDVEGAELEVLRGARKTLERWHPRVLVENHEFQHKGIEHQVWNFMGGLGYSIDGPHQHCAVSHSFFEVKSL